VGETRLEPGGTVDLTIGVDHSQFIVCDRDAEIDIDSYSDEATAAGLATWAGGFAVFTDSHWAQCRVRLTLTETRPDPRLDGCDHAVEAAVEFASGRLELFGPEGAGMDQAVIVVSPGEYGLFVLGHEFGTANEYGDDGDDRYTILLWPGTVPATRVLKAGRPGM